MSAHLLVSIGTNTGTFDDLTISVHVENIPCYVVVLSPEDTRRLLAGIAEVAGRDNDLGWKIELHPVRPVAWEDRLEFLGKLEVERSEP